MDAFLSKENRRTSYLYFLLADVPYLLMKFMVSVFQYIYSKPMFADLPSYTETIMQLAPFFSIIFLIGLIPPVLLMLGR